MRRHEVLRTTYALARREPVQVIHPHRSLPLPPVELRTRPTPRRARPRRCRLCQEHLLLPFDLEKGPVLRALLLRVAPEEHVLNLVFHHVVSDAWSSLVLAHELAALYAAVPRGPAVAAAASCRCSTRTTRCGSAQWLEGGGDGAAARLVEAAARRRAAAGAAHGPAASRRQSFAGARSASCCPGACPSRCWRWAGARAPRPSWC